MIECNECREKQAAAKQTFVFLKPLTKVPPATAGSGARQRVNLSELTKYTEVI